MLPHPPSEIDAAAKTRASGTTRLSAGSVGRMLLHGGGNQLQGGAALLPVDRATQAYANGFGGHLGDRERIAAHDADAARA